MRVVLGTFARSGIEACLGSDVAEGVRTALRHYTRRRRSYSESLALARLCPKQPSVSSRGYLELTVDPEIEEALERQARVWGGVSVEQLATHAVLAYLADLDRVYEREPRL